MFLTSSIASICLLASLLCSLTSGAVARSTADWKSRSIYQIMTDRFARTDGSTSAPCDTWAGMYCGGSWQGIINQLDYIQGMGFTAIQISPVTENLPQTTRFGQAYHGYWPQDIFSTNDNFGSRDDLVALSQELHKRGMYFMVDVVINDMAYSTPNGNQTDIDYSVFQPFNDPKYYHPYCNITDYANYTDAQVCWLGDRWVPLPDLKTEDPEVVDIMGNWGKALIANFSIDGLRVDAAKHVNNAFLQSFANAAGVFTVGEVYEVDASILCPYQELTSSVTDYPNYSAMIKAFGSGQNISALSQQIQITKQDCADTTLLASFSENHDVPRFASYTQDLSLGKSVIAWTILSDGIPMLYQGQEQGFSGNATPFNREAVWTSGFNTNADLYKFTADMNKLRNHAIQINTDYLDYQSFPIYTDQSTIVLRKGSEGHQVVTVLSNVGGSGGDYTVMLPTAYGSGQVVMDVVSCTNTTVSGEGQLLVPISAGAPHVFFPVDQMRGSGLCGMGSFNVSKHFTTPTSGSIPMQSNLYPSSAAIVVAAFMAFCLF